MIEGSEDRVYDRVAKYIDRLLANMRKRTARQIPFRQVEVPPLERLYNFEQMTENDKANFIQMNGMDTWLTAVDEMDTIRRRYKNARR